MAAQANAANPGPPIQIEPLAPEAAPAESAADELARFRQLVAGALSQVKQAVPALRYVENVDYANELVLAVRAWWKGGNQ